MSSKHLASMLATFAISGCGSDFLAVEVLPPRTSITCAAPGANASSLGRGLLDLETSRELHGAYVGDLRVQTTRDAVVDGLTFSYVLPDGASSKTKDAAEDAAIDAPVGDLVLDGDDDATRSAVLENVTLLPRDLAVALRDDDGIDADARAFATIIVEMKPIVSVGDPASIASTFAIDLCRGCLAVKPDSEQCPDGVVEDTFVCRKGQDVASFSCAAPPPAATGT